MARLLESLTKIAFTVGLKGDSLRDWVLEMKKVEEEKGEKQKQAGLAKKD